MPHLVQTFQRALSVLMQGHDKDTYTTFAQKFLMRGAYRSRACLGRTSASLQYALLSFESCQMRAALDR